jgi:hypothetical protein
VATLVMRHSKVAILLAFSLLVVGVIASVAQAQRGQPGLPSRITEAPRVVFGNDVGFRIDRMQDGIPIGRLVVRVDGNWVDTSMPPSAAPPR